MGIYNPHSGDWFGMGFMDFGDFSFFFGGKATKWMDIFVTILVKHGNITIRTMGYLGKPTGNG